MNDLKKQFKIMKKCLKPRAQVYDAFMEMSKLMEMFYEYLEKKK